MDACCNHEFVCILPRMNTVLSTATLWSAVRSGIFSPQFQDTAHSRLDDSVPHKCDCHIRVFFDKYFHTAQYLLCMVLAISPCHTDTIAAIRMDRGHTQHDISLCICVGRNRTFCCTICRSSKSNCRNCVPVDGCRKRNSAYFSLCTAGICWVRGMTGDTHEFRTTAFVSTEIIIVQMNIV